MSNDMDYSAAESSENALFVQILSNYPNMFRRPITKSERIRQEYSRYALTEKFNGKCNTNLTIKQISRKINNMKARLKDKNARHLLGTKTVRYHDWEKLFLNLWTGSDTTSQWKNQTENPEASLENTLNPENMFKLSDTKETLNINAKSATTKTELDIEMKIEPDINLSKDEDDIESVSDISATPHWQIETEAAEPPTEVEFNNMYNDFEQYDKMSIEELKRIVLISQTKMLKAQEAAARAKEKLNLYKLMVLKRRNGESFQNLS